MHGPYVGSSAVQELVLMPFRPVTRFQVTAKHAEPSAFLLR